VWEQIIDRANFAFAEEPGVHIIDGQETFKFLVDGSVLFRFKKGDDAGVTANIPTQIALAFHDHEQDLFGLPEVNRVEVIYQLNMLETEIVDVLVVARDGNAIAWSYSLLDSGEGVVPLPMPAPSEEPPAKPAVRLVRRRDGPETRDRKKRDRLCTRTSTQTCCGWRGRQGDGVRLSYRASLACPRRTSRSLRTGSLARRMTSSNGWPKEIT
jgi:hypothetical protein